MNRVLFRGTQWRRSECDDLLLLNGGQEWNIRPETDSSICYTMAILCSGELRLKELPDGTTQRFEHVAWGGEAEYLVMKDDLLWLPSTVEMWVLCLEIYPLENIESAVEFEWRRVWQAKKTNHPSTVAFRVTSQEDLLRLESSGPLLKTMMYAVRMFAFSKDVGGAFEALQLREESERMLWGFHLDELAVDVLELNVSKRHWLYTVVGDDSESAFKTGDPVFCFRQEHAKNFHDHFEAVARRHGLSVSTGTLTKESIKKLCPRVYV